MIILGVDPGFSITGFGVIQYTQGKVYLLDYGFLRLPQKHHLAKRITIFHDSISDKIKQFNVDVLSIETPFLGKNAQNFLKLGYLRGILYLLSDRNNLELLEFSPREIKSALTGFGGASKEQVARIITHLFPKIGHKSKQDVTDALAISLCGLWRGKQL
ncbi:crossover junction endodeoxyribonuclease RuvC [bacterium]|jgi:crossover junction endodeoxyribonuclease RuvC|nr:crossover junction endodeoxyribonuclease RuvC [bacterium]